MKPRISMIALGVADLEAATDFYERGLGLPKVPSPPGVAFFNLNGSWLGLSERGALARDAGVSPPAALPKSGGHTGVNLAHNVASEAEVDATLAEAEAAGATIVKPAGKADWGGYHGYFADPDGHLWEVAHNPFAWIGPEDI